MMGKFLAVVALHAEAREEFGDSVVIVVDVLCQEESGGGGSFLIGLVRKGCGMESSLLWLLQ